ncbi:MAG: iron-containing alcohol dehydrogenase [Hyphomicrobiales bacterium]
MNPFTLSRVPEILFGAGRLADTPAKLETVGGSKTTALIVADPAMAALGITARLTAALTAAGHSYAIYDSFKGEPKSTDIDAAAALALKAGATAVIGLGGGSALDTAKLAAACAVSGEPVETYQLAAVPLPKIRLPIIAIPTTAGTGAEVTRVAVFSNAQKIKVWAWGEEIKPDIAILDPELTVAVPPHITAATGLDALVHAIEASTNKHRNDGNDLYCHRAISLITANLETAIREPNNLEARGALLLGSCYAGIGIDNCGTALAHNISHAMADLAPIMHGRATGLAMLATIDWVAEGNPSAFARVAAAMGSKADKDAAVEAYQRLVRASGIKISLDGDGFELNRPEKLAERMAAAANAPMRKSTSRMPNDSELLILAQRVYALQ